MIMKTMSFALACLLFCAPAMAESASEKIGVNSALGVSPSTGDFVTEAATGDLFEIRSSELALKQGDAATQKFARQMIADHQKTSRELKDLVQTKKIDVAIPGAPSSSQQSMLDKLTMLKGADFDKQYRQDQTSAHKGAVSAFQRYAKSGDNQDLKQWAEKTAPALEHHLQMAQELDRQASK
jgi:putative membrane protein